MHERVALEHQSTVKGILNRRIGGTLFLGIELSMPAICKPALRVLADGQFYRVVVMNR